jgi:preprotein translocase subunit SecG
MEAVLLVVHLIACLALIGAVLLQRSEGGALGMSGGGTGGFISGRGVADVLVRTTMILGAGFFFTSVVLARIHSDAAKKDSVLERTLDERNNSAFDPLSGAATTPAQPGGASTPAPTPAPAADPLAPVLNQTPPATAPAATAPPASAGPATSAPASSGSAPPASGPVSAPSTQPAPGLVPAPAPQ